LISLTGILQEETRKGKEKEKEKEKKVPRQKASALGGSHTPSDEEQISRGRKNQDQSHARQ